MDFDPQSNVVDVYVRYLRRKLGDDVIETIRAWATASGPERNAVVGVV